MCNSNIYMFLKVQSKYVIGFLTLAIFGRHILVFHILQKFGVTSVR